MKTISQQKTKTTLNFDTNFYFEVKKRALEKRQTVSDYFYELGKNDMQIPVKIKRKPKKSQIDKLFPGFDMGPIKGNLSREEIYDFI